MNVIENRTTDDTINVDNWTTDDMMNVIENRTTDDTINVDNWTTDGQIINPQLNNLDEFIFLQVTLLNPENPQVLTGGLKKNLLLLIID